MQKTRAQAQPSLLQWLRIRFAGYDVGIVLIIGLFLLLLPLSTPRVALSDEVQYYAYLRSFYVDHDLDFRNEYTHFAEIGRTNGDLAVFNALLRTDAQNPNPRTGLLRNVAPVGAAILWAPGFVLADLGVRLARLMGNPLAADGYSWPYIRAVCFMSAFYTLLGLLLTYRLTRRYTGVFAATTATLAIWLATPLVFYTYIAMPWSHGTGMFLFALFLTIWLGGDQRTLATRYAQRSPATWLLLGLVGGLMSITREQLALLLILPAIESVVAYVLLVRQRRWAEVGRLVVGHGLFLVTLVIAISPQLATYQVLNGQPTPSSTVSGKLNFRSPNFFNTLIDLEHGAFLWSPILPLGLLGLVRLGRRDGFFALLLLLAVVVQTYINGAFGTTWHLSGSFGFRRLIECTPVFVVGLALGLEWLRPRIGSLPLIVIVALFIGWNIGLIAQWTFVRPELRKRLVWDQMLQYQLIEVPRLIVGKLATLIFNRCALVKNC